MPISFSVLLDEETSRLLHLLADSSDRSRSGLIRHLIRQAAAESPDINPGVPSDIAPEVPDGA